MEKGGQQESLQGTNILRYLEHHLVFICNTSPAAAPEYHHPDYSSCLYQGEKREAACRTSGSQILGTGWTEK